MAMVWLIPSFFGDIRLVRTGPKTCKMLVEQATPEEARALSTFAPIALKKKWVDPEALQEFAGTFVTGKTFGPLTELAAPIEEVQRLIAKALKPGKKLVSAVKFSNGKLEETHEAIFPTRVPSGSSAAPSPQTVPATSTGADSAPPTSTPVGSTESSKAENTAGSALEAKKPKPEKGTTVAAPTRGCPPPNFSPARLRAREVLTAFLTPEQREDFERHNRFITVGATTGHRYMITSRHATDTLRDVQRTLFDLDEQIPLCVHDWDVPPEEEMHALNILIQLPGWERYCRHLNED